MNEEKKEEKCEEIDWRLKIRLFEASKANTDLKYLLFENPKLDRLPPWVGEIITIVLFAIRSAYSEAYGWDNLTSRLYFELGLKIPKLSNIRDPNERKIQEQKMYSFLEHLPAEFPDYEAGFGHITTGQGNQMNQKEFVALWKFIESEACTKFFLDMDWELRKME